MPPLRKLRGILEFASLFYLFSPCFLFALGYLRFWLAVPFATIMAAGLLMTFRDLALDDDLEPRDPSDAARWTAYARQTAYARPWSWRLTQGLILALVVFLVMYSGLSFFAYQVPDYVKHNAFLRDFTEFSWPVAYAHVPPDNKPAVVYYYIYYYLPAAAFGKLLGWRAANYFTLFWGLCGAYIAVHWFLRLVGKVSVFFALMFFFFGGLHIVGWALLNGWFVNGTKWLDEWLIEFSKHTPGYNNLNFVYPSNLSYLYWVPHQVLAGWIVTGMLVYFTLRRKAASSLFFLWSVLLLWSPFMAVGILPFVALSIWNHRPDPEDGGIWNLRVWAGKFLSFQNVAAFPLLFLVSALFLGANYGRFSREFLWNLVKLPKVWPVLLLFYALEFGVYVAVCPKLDKKKGSLLDSSWLWVAVAFLIVAPFYRMSATNDFESRSTLPAMMVLAACLANAIRTAQTDIEKLCVRFLKVLLVVGACGSIAQLMGAINYGFQFGRTPSLAWTKHINEDPYNMAPFYFGSPESFFCRYLAEDVTFQDVSVASWNATSLSQEEVQERFPSSTTATADGIVFQLERGKVTWVRMAQVGLPATRFHGVMLKASAVHVDGGKREPVPIGKILFRWARKQDVEVTGEQGWPFSTARGIMFSASKDSPNTWNVSAAGKNEWDGEIEQLLFDFYFPEPPNPPVPGEYYEVTILDLDFLK